MEHPEIDLCVRWTTRCLDGRHHARSAAWTRPGAARSPARCAPPRSSCQRGLVIAGLERLQEAHSEKRRDALYDEIICESALALGIAAFATGGRDREALNIHGATYLAMNRAIAGLGACARSSRSWTATDSRGLWSIPGDQCVVRRRRPMRGYRPRRASVLAKVTRDRHHGRAGQGLIPATASQSTRATARRRTMLRIRGLWPLARSHRPVVFEEDALMRHEKAPGPRQGEAERRPTTCERKGYKILGPSTTPARLR